MSNRPNYLSFCRQIQIGFRIGTAVQSQTAVTAYFASKQLLLFAFAWQGRAALQYGLILIQVQYKNVSKTVSKPFFV